MLTMKTSLCQQISFVKDSIMDGYMKSGYADEHFRPEGEKNSSGARHGQWKDYEVLNDFAYVSDEGKPKQVFGKFLVYGEGVFSNGKREGSWKFYTLEDKTFKRILHKEVIYENGVKQGAYVYYFPSGNQGVEGSYCTAQDSTRKVFVREGIRICIQTAS
jgi:hypothetical protein